MCDSSQQCFATEPHVKEAGEHLDRAFSKGGWRGALSNHATLAVSCPIKNSVGLTRRNLGTNRVNVGLDSHRPNRHMSSMWHDISSLSPLQSTSCSHNQVRIQRITLRITMVNKIPSVEYHIPRKRLVHPSSVVTFLMQSTTPA